MRTLPSTLISATSAIPLFFKMALAFSHWSATVLEVKRNALVAIFLIEDDESDLRMFESLIVVSLFVLGLFFFFVFAELSGVHDKTTHTKESFST